MGKQLVIKDANFEQHHVSKLANYTDISNEITQLSSVGRRGTLHYPSNNQPYEFLYATGLGTAMYIAGIDVTAYRGREIVVSIYAQTLLPGYYTTFFVSSFNTTLPWTGTSPIKNAFVSVEDIAPKGNTGGYDVYRLTVPENATHLIFRARTDIPSKVYLLDEE